MAGRRFDLTSSKSETEGLAPDRVGLFCAFGAYFIWGFMPLFFKQLAHVPALEIIAHRVVWAVPLLIVIMAFRRQLADYTGVFKSWAMLRWMLVSAALISVNWLVYVWAVNNGQILAASLGYYLNPLLNVAMGVLFLQERLTRKQWIAVGLAGLAVLVLAAGALSTLWITLSLATSFCLYGFVRKLAPVGAVPGLAVETSLLLPVSLLAAFWFVNQPSAGWGNDPATMWLLAAGGAVTATPLILFAIAARRLSYSFLGFIQYIGPTIQFMLAVFLYDEPLDSARLLAFALIWAGLILFSSEALQKRTV